MGTTGGVLEGLDGEGLGSLREVLLGVGAVYYKRLARTGRAYLRRGEFEGWLEGQPIGSLARSLAVLSALNQSKAYLYWCRDWLEGGDPMVAGNKDLTSGPGI